MTIGRLDTSMAGASIEDAENLAEYLHAHFPGLTDEAHALMANPWYENIPAPKRTTMMCHNVAESIERIFIRAKPLADILPDRSPYQSEIERTEEAKRVALRIMMHSPRESMEHYAEKYDTTIHKASIELAQRMAKGEMVRPDNATDDPVVQALNTWIPPLADPKLN